MNSDAIAILLVALVIFLVCREVMCWYWKQNEQLTVQKKILAELELSNKMQAAIIKKKDIMTERQNKTP